MAHHRARLKLGPKNWMRFPALSRMMTFARCVSLAGNGAIAIDRPRALSVASVLSKSSTITPASKNPMLSGRIGWKRGRLLLASGPKTRGTLNSQNTQSHAENNCDLESLGRPINRIDRLRLLSKDPSKS